MHPPQDRIKDVPAQIKNPALVQQRRRQIVDASVELFIDRGFHKTTTRQIARASGLSVGSLYEYITSKEDVLYLVCEAIHTEIEAGLTRALARCDAGRQAWVEVIREYFRVCHRMSNHILLIYTEMPSLPPQWRKRLLENEVRITGFFVDMLAKLASTENRPHLDARSLELIAHDISVLGHMWAFRRWFLPRHFHKEEYIRLQTDFILGLVEAQQRKGLPRHLQHPQRRDLIPNRRPYGRRH